MARVRGAQRRLRGRRARRVRRRRGGTAGRGGPRPARSARPLRGRAATRSRRRSTSSAGARQPVAAARWRRTRSRGYWQRYCAKNDTIGFFGPLAWGSFGDATAVARPAAWSASRVVHFETWAMEAVAPRGDARCRWARSPSARCARCSPIRLALDRLEAARAAVAPAPREQVAAALDALDRVFEEVTGRPAARADGDSGGGRTVAYLDCMRDLDLTLGPAVLAELRASLPARAGSLALVVRAGVRRAARSCWARSRAPGRSRRSWAVDGRGLRALGPAGRRAGRAAAPLGGGRRVRGLDARLVRLELPLGRPPARRRARRRRRSRRLPARARRLPRRRQPARPGPVRAPPSRPGARCCAGSRRKPGRACTSRRRAAAWSR